MPNRRGDRGGLEGWLLVAVAAILIGVAAVALSAKNDCTSKGGYYVEGTSNVPAKCVIPTQKVNKR